MALRPLTEKEIDRGVTIYCDHHVRYLVYADEPHKVYVSSGHEVTGKALERALAIIAEQRN